MNIDDLIQSIPNSDSDLRVQLSKWVDDWKRNQEQVGKLAFLVEKWHGNVWFKDREGQSNFYNSWLKFKKEAIEGIGGLTVNERLYWFGLINLWDESSELDKEKIRKKIEAND